MIVRAWNARSFQMKRIYLVAFAAGLVASLPASLLAQKPTDTPASASTAPPAAPAPSASPAPEASPSNDTPRNSNDAPRKKTAAKPKMKSLPKAMTQQEIDHSMESGTVPSRYRKNVPKEYQQYVPFEKQ
jgi:hypothetical protein